MPTTLFFSNFYKGQKVRKFRAQSRFPFSVFFIKILIYVFDEMCSMLKEKMSSRDFEAAHKIVEKMPRKIIH